MIDNDKYTVECWSKVKGANDSSRQQALVDVLKTCSDSTLENVDTESEYDKGFQDALTAIRSQVERELSSELVFRIQ